MGGQPRFRLRLMALFFKLPHPGGPAYDPAVTAHQKVWYPKAPPPTPTVPYKKPLIVDGGIVGGKTPGEEMKEVIPELFDFTTACPMGLKGDCHATVDSINLYRLIQHLNDEHSWTREEIADWLDSLEVDLTFKARGGDHADEQDSDEEG